MKTELVVEQIEKLIDEKLRRAMILSSKSLGDNKEFFLHESQKKIDQIKLSLAETLRAP